MEAIIQQYGLAGMFMLSAAEAIFFPVPPDVFLPAMAGTHGALLVSVIATLGSLFGALVGYTLGFWGGNPLAQRLFGADKIARVHGYFERWGVWAIIIAALTPIPFKVFTIAGGIARMSFMPFCLACFFGRLPRYLAVSYLGMGLWHMVCRFLH